MNELLLSVSSGLFVGALFTAIKLPIPAPPVLSGVMGIVGVYGGSIAYQTIVNMIYAGV